MVEWLVVSFTILFEQLELTKSRSKDARYWTSQQRQYSKASSIFGAVPPDTEIAHVSPELRRPNCPGTRRSQEPVSQGIFPFVSSTAEHLLSRTDSH